MPISKLRNSDSIWLAMVIASRRRLLPRPEKKVLPASWFLLWTFVFIAGVWLIPLFCGYPIDEVSFIFLTLVPISFVCYWVSATSNSANFRRFIAGRQGESICTFARAFDCRRTDTRILRAVYEEIADVFKHECPSFPLRPGDHLVKDLGIDPEDLDDMAQVIAFRARRSFAFTEQNPLYGKVDTVAELVHFFVLQPLA